MLISGWIGISVAPRNEDHDAAGGRERALVPIPVKALDRKSGGVQGARNLVEGAEA